MPVFDLYSRRKKRAEMAGQPVVYQYDTLPQPLRVQITKIWDDALGPYYEPHGYGSPSPNGNKHWHFIHDALAREKGLHALAEGRNPRVRCVEYLLGETEIDDCLDIIQLSFLYIARVLGSKKTYELESKYGICQAPDDAISELNFRLREAGVGYRFENGQMMRVDSEFVHTEVVQPALQLLSDPRFKGAGDEFLSAHAHYRAGEYKGCAVDALNAFESTMKVICDAKGWDYPKNAPAANLIKVLRQKDLLPDYLDASFDHLQAVLKSGLPMVRNVSGGHGQGGKPRRVPGYIAAYALHLAAANIVFLVEAFKNSE